MGIHLIEACRTHHAAKDLRKFVQLGTSRALERFGWKATTPLAEGLRRTLDWYLASRNPQNVE